MGEWYLSDEDFFIPGWQGVFAGYSARTWLRAAAHALDVVPSIKKNAMGRWNASCGEAYNRRAMGGPCEIQGKVADATRDALNGERQLQMGGSWAYSEHGG